MSFAFSVSAKLVFSRRGTMLSSHYATRFIWPSGGVVKASASPVLNIGASFTFEWRFIIRRSARTMSSEYKRTLRRIGG